MMNIFKFLFASFAFLTIFATGALTASAEVIDRLGYVLTYSNGAYQTFQLAQMDLRADGFFEGSIVVTYGGPGYPLYVDSGVAHEPLGIPTYQCSPGNYLLTPSSAVTAASGQWTLSHGVLRLNFSSGGFVALQLESAKTQRYRLGNLSVAGVPSFFNARAYGYLGMSPFRQDRLAKRNLFHGYLGKYSHPTAQGQLMSPWVEDAYSVTGTSMRTTANPDVVNYAYPSSDGFSKYIFDSLLFNRYADKSLIIRNMGHEANNNGCADFSDLFGGHRILFLASTNARDTVTKLLGIEFGGAGPHYPMVGISWLEKQ